MSDCVYILHCGDGSLYTGWTNNLAARVKAHQERRGAKYTKSHQPVELIYFEVCANRSAALKREAQIKRMTRAQKLLLIAGQTERRDDQTS